MFRVFSALMRDESGVTMTEYAIILTLLSAASTAALVAIAQSANGSLAQTSGGMQTYQLNSPP